MFRLLIFLAALASAAWGLTWLADNPGVVTLTWRGVEYDVSLMLAVGLVAALGIALSSSASRRSFRWPRGRASARRVLRLCRGA